jgi:hypothetical protein
MKHNSILTASIITVICMQLACLTALAIVVVWNLPMICCNHKQQTLQNRFSLSFRHSTNPTSGKQKSNLLKQQAAFFTEGEIPFSGVVLATEPTAQLGT